MRPDSHSPVGRVLVVDVGSSTTKLALVSGGGLTRVGSFATGDDGPAGWQARFEAAVAADAVVAGAIGYLALSSVRPDVADRLRTSWSRAGGDPVPVRTVSARSVAVAIDYRPPSSLGLDRIANAVAAIDRWGAPVIVADVGTAITCDLVAEGPRFAGGAIAPGPVAAYEGLVAGAPHLARPGQTVDPRHLPAVPTSTGDAVLVGLRHGAAALVDGLVRRYQRVTGPCPVVITGGLGALVGRDSETVTALDPDLTLRGIHLATRSAPPDAG